MEMGGLENVQIDSFVYRVPTQEEGTTEEKYKLYALVEVNYRKSMGLGKYFVKSCFISLFLKCALDNRFIFTLYSTLRPVIQRLADMHPDAKYIEWRVFSVKNLRKQHKEGRCEQSEVRTWTDTLVPDHHLVSNSGSGSECGSSSRSLWIHLSPPKNSFHSFYRPYY